MLRVEVLHAADALAALDVAHRRPDLADTFLNLDRDPQPAPPGVPARAAEVADRALRLLEAIETALADGDGGGAVSLTELNQREAAIAPLARACRQALSAAGSVDAWPPR